MKFENKEIGRRTFLAICGISITDGILSKCSARNTDINNTLQRPLTKEEREIVIVEQCKVEKTDEEFSLYDYWLAFSSGIGIAIDVFVATVAMWRSLDTAQKKLIWVGGVGVSHIVLPIMSGAAAYGGDQLSKTTAASNMITKGIATVAAGAVYNHTIGVIKDEEGEEEFDFNFKNFGDLLLKIMAVSMDALATGPAKYEQMKLAGWSQKKSFNAIAIGGFTVMGVAMTALKLAEKLQAKFAETNDLEAVENDSILNGRIINEENLTKFEVIILNYFGANSLINGTFASNAGFWTVNGANLLSTMGLYKIFQKTEEKEDLV